MMKVSLHGRFRHAKHGADRCGAVDLDQRLQDAHFIRRQAKRLLHGLESRGWLECRLADEDRGDRGIVEPGRAPRPGR